MSVQRFLIGAVVVLSAWSAGASLIGDTIDGNYDVLPVGGTNYFGEAVGSGTSAVVGVGPEFTLSGNLFDMAADFSAESLVLEYDWTHPNQGIVFAHVLTFSDLDWVGTPGTIVGFNLTTPGIPALSSFGFTGDSVYIQFDDLDMNARDNITLGFEIEVMHNNPIPEPATVTLMGLGLVCLVVRRAVA